jgi:POT family proton-dependent oligopeptide transporter
MRLALQKGRYPITFWGLFFVAAALMFSFAFYLGTLVLYFINTFKLPTDISYEMNGIFSALVYISCVVGGAVTQRWLKHTQGIIIGLLFLGLGCIGTAFSDFHIFISGLSLFLCGYGLVYTSVFYLLGQLYPLTDPHRESYFTLCYTGLNVGALIGFLWGGIAISQGLFQQGAIVIGIFLIVSSVFFYLNLANRYHEKMPTKFGLIFSFAALIFFAVINYFLLKVSGNVQTALSVLCLIFILFIFVLGYREKAVNPDTSKNLYLLGALLLITIVFWTGYRLQNNIILVFLQQHVSRDFFGVLIPGPTVFGINPLVILIFGPLLSIFFLRNKKLYLNNPVLKISVGLFLLGLGFFSLFFGVYLKIPTSLGWVILFFIFLSFGELILGPTTISMVGRLAPEKYQSLLLGVVRTDMSVAAIFAGQIAVFFNNYVKNAGNLQYGYIYIFISMAVILLFFGSITLLLKRGHYA